MLVDFYMMGLPLPVRGPAESEARSKVVKLGFDTLKNAKAALMLNLNVSMNGLLKVHLRWHLTARRSLVLAQQANVIQRRFWTMSV